MSFGITTQDANEARPLWLVGEGTLGQWRARLAPVEARWVTESGFRAEAHRLLLLPGPRAGCPRVPGGWRTRSTR